MEKQVSQMRNLINYREIVLETKNKTKVLNYESNNNMIALKISFYEKEHYKKHYGVQWHIELGLWFINKSKILLCLLLFLFGVSF